jgi:dipeptidase
MKKIFLYLSMAVILFVGWAPAYSCTTVAVGSKATKDGSVIVSHSNDALRDARVVRVSAADHPKGSLRNVYYEQPACGYLPEYGGVRYRNYVGKDRGTVYDTGETPSKPIGTIPQVGHTYAYFESVYGIMNEHQLSIGETTCRAKVDNIKPDPEKRIFYSSSLARVALERCRKARNAVMLIGSLIDQYGYYGTGECLVLADTEEAWVIEMCGYDTDGSDGLWVAKRVPDDGFFVSANQFRIREVTKNSSDMMYSSNLFAVCEKKGWWKPEDGELDWAAAVGEGEYHHPYSSLRRVWRILSRVKPSANFSPYVKDALTSEYPFTVTPDKPLSVLDVISLHRDYYEGTEFDLTKGAAAGAYGNPIRYDDSEKNSEIKGAFERSLSIYRCIYTVVNQSRSWLPDPVGGLMWVSFDSPAESCFMPIYTGVINMPPSFIRGAMVRYDPESAWWTFNLVANYATIKYSYMIKDIKSQQQKLEGNEFRQEPEIEKKAATYWEQGEKQWCRDYLTTYCKENAANVMESWRKLWEQLVVGYNDGYRIGPDGHKDKIGYPAEWLKAVDYENGPTKYRK